MLIEMSSFRNFYRHFTRGISPGRLDNMLQQWRVVTRCGHRSSGGTQPGHWRQPGHRGPGPATSRPPALTSPGVTRRALQRDMSQAGDMADQHHHYHHMVPLQQQQEEEGDTVFSIVNYSVAEEMDEGYSTNYSPSSKSTSSFECDTSFDRSENSNSDIQVGLLCF